MSDDPLNVKAKLPRPTVDQKRFMVEYLTHWGAVFTKNIQQLESYDGDLPAKAYGQYNYWCQGVKLCNYMLAILQRQRPSDVERSPRKRQKPEPDTGAE